MVDLACAVDPTHETTREVFAMATTVNPNADGLFLRGTVVDDNAPNEFAAMRYCFVGVVAPTDPLSD
ncbi:hypothetical protein [Aeromicrobium sp. UC242_57]|uniref:hypothetical protein n=1 Tax=Aeromicrobium sp. UC242_57 TaxID=3374624 RepID=UPI0037BE252E